jgi:enoyl-CoA hydratase/carnithine racemase
MEGYTFVMTLNRPESMNAFNSELIAAVGEAWGRVREDSDIRSVVITGAGDRAFCAGADLTQGDGPAASAGPAGHFEADPGPRFDEFDAKKPLIAAINGHALGGGFEIALVCDLRIGAENARARLGLPEITLGFFPLAGGPMRLPRAIPQAYANEMLYLGRRLSMQEALQWGVISRLVPQDELLPTAQEMAAQVAGYAPIAVRAMKELINAQGDMTLSQANRFGGSLRWIVGQTEDSKEGPRAFAERRQPDFKGR